MELTLRNGVSYHIDRVINIVLDNPSGENCKEYRMGFSYPFIPSEKMNYLYLTKEDYKFMEFRHRGARHNFEHCLDSYCFDPINDPSVLNFEYNKRFKSEYIFIRYSDNEFILQFDNCKPVLLKFSLGGN